MATFQLLGVNMTSSILLTRPRKTLASECWLWHFWQIWTHQFMLVLRFFAKKHSFGAMPWKKWPKKWFLGPKSTFLAQNPLLTPPTHWLGQKTNIKWQFNQPETTAGANRDSDARNCCDARTVSDARSSSGARGKGADSPHVPTPASHSLAPWSP